MDGGMLYYSVPRTYVYGLHPDEVVILKVIITNIIIINIIVLIALLLSKGLTLG